MKKILLSIISVVITIPTLACTNFLVGKDASADGSTFISYSADSYGMYGKLLYYPAAKHAKGEMRRIVDGDTNHYLGEIPEAPETYSVIGNINEYQVSIMETTFGGREELADPDGKIDYVSLMALGMQRAKTAREAIKVMTDLVQQYGYASEGESFSVADPNEVWIMEMIGKGPNEKGAVWVAVRIPDDCIAVHANHSRIHQFDMKDKKNVMYSKDVVDFARKKGFFSGSDEEFSFSTAYAPADFGAIRYCETRAWSFFNLWVEGMDKYLDYADGRHIDTAKPFPLYMKPKRKLSLKDVMNSMRDHYENTPFDITKDVGAGPFSGPYRTTPLSWEHEGKKYFNERPISTMQSSYTVVAQMRSTLPNAIGGILWFGNDDANMIAYTPVYCCTTTVPKCYDVNTANDVTFSWESAFWVCNWVANMTYPRYSHIFPAVMSVREKLENGYIQSQPETEAKALALYNSNPQEAKAFLNDYTNKTAADMLEQWKKLGEYIIVKYNDQCVKPEVDGKFKMTRDGIAVPPQRPGYDDMFKEIIVKESGERYKMPEK